MPTVHFLGKVFPVIKKIDFGNLPQPGWRHPTSGLELNFNIRITQSMIDVQVELNRIQPDEFSEIYNRSFDVARAFVDTISFAMGWGLTVVLETYVTEQGKELSILASCPHLENLCTAYKINAGTVEEKRTWKQCWGSSWRRALYTWRSMI